jgi:hypothetical protein
VVTDPVPRTARLRCQYEASDARITLPLPPGLTLERLSAALKEAMASGAPGPVRLAGGKILRHLSGFYGVSTPKLTVLGARPLDVLEGNLSYELFGDYTPSTEVIRVWMRTAVLGKVTSHRGLLNTLLHEFCHHLDVNALDLPDTPHTRGFYARVDELYHLALGTPVEKRRPLVWIRQGSSWRIDWSKLRAG